MQIAELCPWLDEPVGRRVATDGYPFCPDDPFRDEQQLLNLYIDGPVGTPKYDFYERPDEALIQVAVAACIRIALLGHLCPEMPDEEVAKREAVLQRIVERILQRNLVWSEPEIELLVGSMIVQGHRPIICRPFHAAAPVIERYALDHPLSPKLKAKIEALAAEFRNGMYSEDSERLLEALRQSPGTSTAQTMADLFIGMIKRLETESAENGPDLYPVFDGDPQREQQLALNRYLDEAFRESKVLYSQRKQVLDCWGSLTSVPVKARAPLVVAACVRASWIKIGRYKLTRQRVRGTVDLVHGAIRELLKTIFRGSIPFSESDLLTILSCIGGLSSELRGVVNFNAVFKGVQRYVDEHGLSEEMRAALEGLRATKPKHGYVGVAAKLEQALDRILGNSSKSVLPIVPGEVWSDEAIYTIQRGGSGEVTDWTALLEHCRSAKGAKPSAAWLKKAKKLADRLPGVEFVGAITSWLACLNDYPDGTTDAYYWLGTTFQLFDENRTILRGLTWCLTMYPGDGVADSLADAALASFKKVPNFGARYVKNGNACLWSLAQLPGLASIAQLSRLKLKFKKPSVVKQIEKALDAAAEREGLPRSELEEIGVPEYGLSNGVRRESLGEFTAEVAITGIHSVELRWIKADGKTQKTVPKRVKEEHADALRELKKNAKDIKSLLPAQRARIERLYLQPRTWPLDTWRKRYLDHPLVGFIARRLIWQFGDTSGMWLDGNIVGQDGESLAAINGEVSLWHPLNRPLDEVLGWRAFLDKHEIMQPFKQAHREVYIVTDAELETSNYSNRFAAHILKQHQFKALCDQREWSYMLQGQWDSHNTPIKTLADWDMTVEYWVDAVEDVADTNVATELGIYLYLTTDQVRFMRGGAPMELTDVPPIVFTEIMREVDLFVGVCSVGNDPNWQNNNRENFHADYWTSYAFGELSESAKTRHGVLANLLPRLKIADRCELEERFLKVNGSLRTYRIHLGSGNIQMEPGNQYLCIVQGRGGNKDTKFLPFEGDGIFSIILSKAFMLADDRRIKDKSILSQIHR